MNMGLLGDLFGGGTSALSEYLTPEQQESMQRQALLSTAAALLQAGGPSATPISLGQALGAGLQAGTSSYGKAQEGAIQQLMVRQKLDEAARLKRMQDWFEGGITTPTAQAQQAPIPGQVISPQQALLIGATPDMPYGPTVQRAQMIGQPMPENMAVPSMGAAPMPVRPTSAQDIIASMTPDMRKLASMDPKTAMTKLFEEGLKRESFDTVTGAGAEALGLSPQGIYQTNRRTGQITTIKAPEGFKVVTGKEAKAFGLNPMGTWQINTQNNQATQVATPEGPLGGGLQGNAYNILLNEDPGSPKYALAYRALSQPVPVEKIQPDGSVRTVYEQPAPLPASFPKPTYRGKAPEAPAPSLRAPAVTGGAAPIAAPAAGQVSQGTVGATGIEPGTKRTPYAPTEGQIGEARKQILTINKLMGSVNALETHVTQNGLQIGGLGARGGEQEGLFTDAMLQLKELQNLGVLNGPDERLMLNQLADPTSLRSFLKGAGSSDYVFSKIRELKSKAGREMELINKQFPRPIVETQQQAAPTGAQPRIINPPKDIQDIQNKYK
jgi:hypothetical protein